MTRVHWATYFLTRPGLKVKYCEYQLVKTLNAVKAVQTMRHRGANYLDVHSSRASRMRYRCNKPFAVQTHQLPLPSSLRMLALGLGPAYPSVRRSSSALLKSVSYTILSTSRSHARPGFLRFSTLVSEYSGPCFLVAWLVLVDFLVSLVSFLMYFWAHSTPQEAESQCTRTEQRRSPEIKTLSEDAKRTSDLIRYKKGEKEHTVPPSTTRNRVAIMHCHRKTWGRE